ncbi:alpha/beta fold hydrolase [Salipiger sp. PrR002]|uniref:alpha/beta fold hydrolase n=1 Tax=Salipiger sp. PrR002 TaxID=2706489 RepID=UPI0013B97CC4|nr:alpha/beta hydrolase [Salipiger sp. PrR002]NDV99997.1 alpha/beta fold hydrolase [Salipiger sp. PrR002]NDW56210.1 alpha/beta fold hydrolase [Salipiger sp. PrR004]
MIWTTRRRSDLGDGLAGIEAGSSGPRVLLIHGVGLRAEAWGAQLEALAQHCRVTAVDMPGHGESTLAGENALADYAGRIASLLDGPALIAGHSMGAMIAAEIARQVPERVSALACLNAIYRRSDEAKKAVAARAAQLDGLSIADPEPTLSRWFEDAETPARAACRDWLTGADPEGYRAAYRVFAAEDGPRDDTLRGLSCPALFMTGGREPNSTPAMSQAMAALVPQGRAVVLPDAAHMMPMTHADAVTAELLRLIPAHG